jgi:hypothetical protein
MAKAQGQTDGLENLRTMLPSTVTGFFNVLGQPTVSIPTASGVSSIITGSTNVLGQPTISVRDSVGISTTITGTTNVFGQPSFTLPR